MKLLAVQARVAHHMLDQPLQQKGAIPFRVCLRQCRIIKGERKVDQLLARLIGGSQDLGPRAIIVKLRPRIIILRRTGKAGRSGSTLVGSHHPLRLISIPVGNMGHERFGGPAIRHAPSLDLVLL